MQVLVVFLIGICAFARIASAASSPLETIIEEWEVWTIEYIYTLYKEDSYKESTEYDEQITFIRS